MVRDSSGGAGEGEKTVAELRSMLRGGWGIRKLVGAGMGIPCRMSGCVSDIRPAHEVPGAKAASGRMRLRIGSGSDMRRAPTPSPRGRVLRLRPSPGAGVVLTFTHPDRLSAKNVRGRSISQRRLGIHRRVIQR